MKNMSNFVKDLHTQIRFLKDTIQMPISFGTKNSQKNDDMPAGDRSNMFCEFIILKTKTSLITCTWIF